LVLPHDLTKGKADNAAAPRPINFLLDVFMKIKLVNYSSAKAKALLVVFGI